MIHRMVTSERLSGTATPEATAHATAGLGPHAATALGRSGLTVTRLGFGCYRVDDRQPVFAEALHKALAAGVNVIDTSTNYTDGGSERCVGAVLASAHAAGRLRREQIVVVSKIGYVQGENLTLARAREREGRPFPEMVKYMDGCWHCLHPTFLANQLERSLARLQLATLDVCLLHNPEYFFSDAVHRGASVADLPQLRAEFYRRLEAAFAFFEAQIAMGRLRGYGVSSNSAAAPGDDPEMTSLGRMFAAAEAAGGGGHHFQVLQLPMNLYESGALFERNDAGGTVLERARALGVGVLVNRPLNAIVDRQLVRLAGARGSANEAALDAALPAAARAASFAQKALHALTSVEGVSSVLLGMRRPAYVDDALAVLGLAPLEPATTRDAFAAFRG